jgi:hypothetical protein
MRKATTLWNVGMLYLVGIVWCIVMMLSALALLDPMISASATLDVRSPMATTLATMGLAVLLATLVAGGLAGLLKRTAAERIEVTDHV